MQIDFVKVYLVHECTGTLLLFNEEVTLEDDGVVAREDVAVVEFVLVEGDFLV